jgi:NADPH-dependent ferric siderophore reductase
MRRIVFGGGDLERFVWPGPASHLKLMLPLPGQDAPALPTPGPDGVVTFDRSGMTMRTYTPRSWDDAKQELTIDVFLHGDGPASTWARQVGPGGQVAISPPRATWQPDPDAEWLVLAGDETAVPAIGTLVESCAGLGVRPTVVIESAGDDLDLGLPAGADPHFVVADPEAPGRALLEALTRTVPSGDGQVWVAGEARGVRAVRAWLQGERGLPAAATVTRGYWKAGAVDHPDHDYGED